MHLARTELRQQEVYPGRYFGLFRVLFETAFIEHQSTLRPVHRLVNLGQLDKSAVVVRFLFQSLFQACLGVGHVACLLPQPGIFNEGVRPVWLLCQPFFDHLNCIRPAALAHHENDQCMPARCMIGILLQTIPIILFRPGSIPEMVVALADIIEQRGIP